MATSSEEGRRIRLVRLVLPAALLAGVLLRAEYLRELISTPFWYHLLLDAEWYDEIARRFAEGAPLGQEQLLFRAPLYPLLLSSVYRWFGPGLLGPRLLQMGLGLVLVVVCWRIAFRTHGRRVAALTAVLAATYGMFIYYEAELLGASVATLLAALALLSLLEGDAQDSLRRLFFGGLALGLAAVTHALALVMAPVAAFWILRSGRRVLPITAFALGLAIPVGGFVARNYAATGVPVLAAQGGINFYIGNNGHADGRSALAPGGPSPGDVFRGDVYRDNVAMAARTLAEEDLGRELTVLEVDRYWYRRALDWMAEHPRAALGLLARKVVFFWNGYEIGNNRDFRDQAARFTPILGPFLGQYSFLLPFAIFGFLVAPGKRRPRRLILLMIAAWTAGVAAYFVCTRFRLPVVPWLLPYGAAGMLAFFDLVRRARVAPAGLGRASLLLVFAFALTNGLLISRAGVADVVTQVDAPFHRFNLAVLYERQGDLDQAIAEYRAASSTGVPDPRVALNLGNVLARTGRAAEAREEYRRVLRFAPEFTATVRSNLGVLASQERDWPEAIRQFERALEADPDQKAALVGLASSLLSAARFDDAVVAHRRALAAEAAPEETLRRSLAVAYLEMGLLEEAEREAHIALRLDPDDVVSVLTLGRIQIQRGSPEAARLMWAKAREIAPGVPAVEEAIRKAEQARP